MEVRRTARLSPKRAAATVNLLVEVGAVERRSRELLLLGRPVIGTVLDRAVAHVAARERVERSRVEMMRAFAEIATCRREFLLGYFGEQYLPPCGNCDNCLTGNSRPSLEAEGLGDFAVQDEVVHRTFGIGTVMRIENDRLTVFFPDHGYRTLDRERVVNEGILDLGPAATRGRP